MKTFVPFLLALVPLACGGSEEKAPDKAPAKPAADLGAFELAADPGEALDVVDAKEAAPKEDVIVVGRIDNIVKGFASFNLVDVSLDYCGGGEEEDNCPTPWDYCCIPRPEKVEATLTVEARGKDGRVISTGAIPGLRLLDLVAVKGTLSKDEHGNVLLVAEGWHRRERPDLPEGLHWPE